MSEMKIIVKNNRYLILNVIFITKYDKMFAKIEKTTPKNCLPDLSRQREKPKCIRLYRASLIGFVARGVC